MYLRSGIALTILFATAGLCTGPFSNATTSFSTVLVPSTTVTSVVASSSLAPPTISDLPSGTITCGGNTYSPTDDESAGQQAVLKVNSPIGQRNSPHIFNNREGLVFPNCSSSGLNEFPILAGGAVYAGGAPGADRIVLTIDADTSSGTFCGLITHTGAPTRGGFVLCASDVVVNRA